MNSHDTTHCRQQRTCGYGDHILAGLLTMASCIQPAMVLWVEHRSATLGSQVLWALLAGFGLFYSFRSFKRATRGSPAEGLGLLLCIVNVVSMMFLAVLIVMFSSET